MNISVDNKDYTIHELREWAVFALGGFAGLAFSAILDHIEAQQGERQAFVAGADWHANLQYGPYNAEVEATKRYPAARPMPTREQVYDLIDSNVESADGGSAYGIDNATDAIMALLGGQNA